MSSSMDNPIVSYLRQCYGTVHVSSREQRSCSVNAGQYIMICALQLLVTNRCDTFLVLSVEECM